MDTVDRIFALVDQKYQEQQQFAHALGVYPSLVSAWRNRKSTSYSKRLPEIAMLLGTTTDYLFSGEDGKSPPPAEGGELDRNTIIIVGRDGTRIERELTDEQVVLMKTMLDQLKPVDDGNL